MSAKREVSKTGEPLRCPSCGAKRDASDRFCRQCGANRDANDRFCRQCGAKRDANDRFCRECGASLQGAAKPNGRALGLTGLRAFGLAIVALVVVAAFLYYGGRGNQSTQPPAQRIGIGDVGSGLPGQPGTLGAAPPSPRVAADELFNEAMAAYETGDATGARQFVPAALAAYAGLESLDIDARYHIALLNIAVGRPEDAMIQVDAMLAEVPEHLLGLAAGAAAAVEMGREDEAIDYFQRFLAAYTPDVAATRPEYVDHSRALPGRRDEALRYLAERGVTREGS